MVQSIRILSNRSGVIMYRNVSNEHLRQVKRLGTKYILRSCLIFQSSSPHSNLNSIIMKLCFVNIYVYTYNSYCHFKILSKFLRISCKRLKLSTKWIIGYRFRMDHQWSFHESEFEEQIISNCKIAPLENRIWIYFFL